MTLAHGQSPLLPLQGFKPLEDSSFENRVLMIANNTQDYSNDSDRLIHLQKLFTQQSQTSYILPLNANLGLTAEETQDLFKQISEKFPLLVALGER